MRKFWKFFRSSEGLDQFQMVLLTLLGLSMMGLATANSHDFLIPGEGWHTRPATPLKRTLFVVLGAVWLWGHYKQVMLNYKFWQEDQDQGGSS